MILNISITLPDDADRLTIQSAVSAAGDAAQYSILFNGVLAVDEMRELDDGFGETVCTFFRSE